MSLIKKLSFIALVLGSGAVLFTACRPAGNQPAVEAAVVESVNRGVSHMGHYEYQAAVEAFEAALERSPDLIPARINLAISLFNRASKEDLDLERATTLLDGVLREEPGNLRALYFKGIILQHQGQAEEAIPLFEQVIGQRPDEGAAWYLLGLCRWRLQQPCEAELLRSVELKPYLFSAWYKLSQIAMREGDAEKAKSYLTKFKECQESPLGESIELPQYNQMGELALVKPLTASARQAIVSSRYEAGSPVDLFNSGGAGSESTRTASLAGGDFNADGLADLVVVDGIESQILILLGQPDGSWIRVASPGKFPHGANIHAIAVGDFDNDEKNDLFFACEGPNFLFQGQGDGTFADVTAPAGIAGHAVDSFSALFLDADHDADLDLFVCNGSGRDGLSASNCLWNNNGDGTFTDVAQVAGVACSGDACLAVLPGDLDGDRDMDLVVLRREKSAVIFLNDLLGKFTERPLIDVHGDRGGVLQDFNGDGRLDLMVLGGDGLAVRLFTGDGRGGLIPDAAMEQLAVSLASWGEIHSLRAADLDLDGDLDVALFADAGHAMLNDGQGRFVLLPRVWKMPMVVGVEVMDLNRDFIPDLVALDRTGLVLIPGVLSLPANALSLAPTGVRSRDKRTRSPASGFGVRLTLRAGLHEQALNYTGIFGGASQSGLPLVLGLAGAAKADYVTLHWPDGVTQVETGLVAGQNHVVSEVERKVSSCPVLFTWNGERLQFVTDFAGVGGLGYFAAPGESAPPQVLEHIKIESDQLTDRDGFYELRITEPMEETAYIDRLELQVIDHLADTAVFPDECLAITGAAPTHALLVADERIFPGAARSPDGSDCLRALLQVDRRYAYPPKLDRRYCGFCEAHSLELDFGDRLKNLGDGERVFLFLQGFIEYPYSQTVYAASQSRVGWEAIRIDRLNESGEWEILVPDAGVPGGMARMMTVDVTGLLNGPGDCRLRLTTNLEIYYDQIFLARDRQSGRPAVHSLPVAEAELRKVGFALEFSPDGRMPLIYDYDLTETTAPFHVLKGAYTRYGAVRELLTEFDDRYVLVGPGDEIAVRFDATDLPPVSTGMRRSYILVSHAYCKDMDLYTATPETLEPLPFKAMTRYPYGEEESYPDTPEHRAFRHDYNTRIVQ